jgi:tetratricopeptide (TPR) repeat protein
MEILTVFSRNRHILVAVSLLGVAAGAQAAETAHTPMVLTAYSNGAGGASLMKGDYTDALSEIQHSKPQMMLAQSAQATNLCVAYAATKQLTEAKSACDAALRQAKYDRLTASRFTPGSSHENSYVAIAYTNRAVVSMLSKDEAGAKADLERAKVLAPSADFVAKNVAAVAAKSRSTIAQIEVSPSR